ncbi:MAG: ABC transporter substrate-binding protein [Acidobacteriota bacterium]|nr:ABC transporter substrate-binding protein [Acidobacteriota bacterium]
MALVAVGCGSSKSSSSGSTGSNASLGTPNAASGSPLKVGYITDGQNGSINNLTEVPAAQAAVKYVNAYLGGVAGHVLSLDVCNNGDTPSGATDCVNQMITDKVPVVLYNVDGQGETTYGGLSKAGVPVMAYGSIAQNELTGKLSYIVTNGLATAFAGPAAIAQSVKAKRAAVFVTNVPAAAGPVQALDPIIYKNAGVPLDVVPVAPSTPDLTPEVQAELGKGVDFIAMVGDVSFCTSVVKAEKTLNFTGTTVLIAQCLASGSSAGIPGGYTGMKVVTAATTDPTNPDVKLYVAAMKAYASGTAPFANGVTSGGWATVISFANAMKGLNGTPSSASIEAAFSSMAPEPIPFGNGTTFQCNGKQVSITPAVCSTGALQETLDQAGNAVGAFTPIDVASLLKL